MDRFFMYLGFLAPLISICVLLLVVKFAQNRKLRKAGKQKGWFE